MTCRVNVQLNIQPSFPFDSAGFPSSPIRLVRGDVCSASAGVGADGCDSGLQGIDCLLPRHRALANQARPKAQIQEVGLDSNGTQWTS